MSQILLDDQLLDVEVVVPLARWITVQRLRDLRPNEVIKDDRVPLLLCELRQPSVVTIDVGLWNKGLQDPRYCILCFSLRNDEQHQLAERLYRLFQLPKFRTKAARMGKVARVGPERIEHWTVGDEQMRRVSWAGVL